MTDRPDKSISSVIAALCPACSMCCNGVLFADVRLQKKDDPRLLKKLGLPLEKHRANHRFCQPCSALQEGLCTVYQHRPARCRTFECRLLKNVHAGNTKPGSALRLIQKTRKQADKVNSLLEKLGNRDTQQSISRRFQEVMSQPWDLGADEDVTEARSLLMREMGILMQLVQKEFLT